MDVLKKVPVREQDPKVRATNFNEVCLGYNKEEAMEEASRFGVSYTELGSIRTKIEALRAEIEQLKESR